MERFLPIVLLVGWFGSVFAASYLINWLLVRGIVRKYYRFFVAPGVLVHELSHAVGCMATGAQILEINFWKRDGGHVKHYQPQIPIFGEPIIALAPIGGTFIMLLILTWVMVPELAQALNMSKVSISAGIVSAIDWTRWQTWLYFYLVTSLLATIAPSKTDLRYALASLVAIGVILILLSFVPFVPGLILGWFESIKSIAFFTLLLLILGIVISFMLALPYRNKHFIPREQLD